MERANLEFGVVVLETKPPGNAEPGARGNIKLLKPAVKPAKFSMTLLKKLLADLCMGVQAADILLVRSLSLCFMKLTVS